MLGARDDGGPLGPFLRTGSSAALVPLGRGGEQGLVVLVSLDPERPVSACGGRARNAPRCPVSRGEMASSTLLPVRRLLLAAVLVAAVPGAAAADTTPPATTTAPAAPAAPVAPADGLIAPGVTIGGVPVGGMTTSQARAALGAAYQAPVTFTLGKHTFTATAKRLGLHVYVNNPVRARVHGRAASRLRRPATSPSSRRSSGRRSTATSPTSRRRSAASRSTRRSVLKSEKPFVWKDVWGRTIDKTTAREAIVERAAQSGAPGRDAAAEDPQARGARVEAAERDRDRSRAGTR